MNGEGLNVVGRFTPTVTNQILIRHVHVVPVRTVDDRQHEVAMIPPFVSELDAGLNGQHCTLQFERELVRSGASCGNWNWYFCERNGVTTDLQRKYAVDGIGGPSCTLIGHAHRHCNSRPHVNCYAGRRWLGHSTGTACVSLVLPITLASTSTALYTNRPREHERDLCALGL